MMPSFSIREWWYGTGTTTTTQRVATIAEHKQLKRKDEDGMMGSLKIVPLFDVHLKLYFARGEYALSEGGDRGGALSLKSAINLSEEAKEKARIPRNATHFAYAYPCPEVQKTDRETVKKFMGVGGFVYFTTEEEIVGINTFDEGGEDLVFDKETDFKDLLKLIQLAKSNRLQPVKQDHIRSKGFVQYCWLAPHETDTSGDVLSNNGAFLFVSAHSAVICRVKDSSMLHWEWHFQGSSWVSYDLKSMKVLQEGYEKGQKKVRIEGRQPYIVDLEKMVQENLMLRTKRPIRRAYVMEKGIVHWLVYIDKSFKPYDPETSDLLEKGWISALTGGPLSTVLTSEKMQGKYSVNFHEMVQTNTLTKFSRPIRRMVIESETKRIPLQTLKKARRRDSRAESMQGQLNIVVIEAKNLCNNMNISPFVTISSDFSNEQYASKPVAGSNNPLWNFACSLELKGATTGNYLYFHVQNEQGNSYLGFLEMQLSEVFFSKKIQGKKKLLFEIQRTAKGVEAELEIQIEYIQQGGYRIKSQREISTYDLFDEKTNRLVSQSVPKSDDYVVTDLLGKGTFADVFKATNTRTQRVCAAKRIIKLVDNSQDYEDKMNEIRIMELLKNEYCVSLVELRETIKYIFIVMEFCDGDNLFDASQNGITEDEIKRVAHNMLHALSFIHSIHVVHRDIKPENILSCKSQDGTAIWKLVDFGISATIQPGGYLTEKKGSYHYCAPELFSNRYNHMVDLWSLGVTLYVCMTGCFVWSASEENEIVDQILHQPVIYDEDDWESRSEESKDFIATLLQKNPESRGTPQELLNHPWLTLNT